MPNLDDVARTYASQIRAASESAMAKTASAGTVPPDFLATVTEVISDLDTWKNGDGSTITPEQVRQICRYIDDELGLEDDTFWTVKKGSVQSLISYQRQVLLMFNSLRYR